MQTGCVTLEKIMRQNDREPGSLDTTLLQAQGYSIPPGGMPTGVDMQASDRPSIVLEVRSDGDKRHVERIPVPMDRGVFIEEIVQEAKLNDRIGKLRINIMRPNGPTAPPVRLDLYTDEDGKAATLGTNYALLPGDHVIVSKDETSAFKKWMQNPFSGR
jgi:hypothetical protein